MILPKSNALIAGMTLGKIVLHAIKLAAKCADKASFTIKTVTIIMNKIGRKRSRRRWQNVSLITALLGSAETWS